MFDHVLIQYTVLDEKTGLYEAKEYMDESSPTIFRQGGRKNKDEDKMLAPWCQKSVSHIDPHCFWCASFSKKACLHRIFWYLLISIEIWYRWTDWPLFLYVFINAKLESCLPGYDHLGARLGCSESFKSTVMHHWNGMLCLRWLDQLDPHHWHWLT